MKYVPTIALVLTASLAAPAAAMTCDEYEDLMYQEGVRTLEAVGCSIPDLPDDWNEILDGPAGSCLIARAIAGEPAALGLTAYMTDMNKQRRELGCPLKTDDGSDTPTPPARSP